MVKEELLNELIDLNRVIRDRTATSKQKNFAVEKKRENELKVCSCLQHHLLFCVAAQRQDC